MYANYKHSDCREESFYPLRNRLQERPRDTRPQKVIVQRTSLHLYDPMPRFRGTLVLPPETPSSDETERKSYILGISGAAVLLTACLLGLTTIWKDFSNWPAAAASALIVIVFFMFFRRMVKGK